MRRTGMKRRLSAAIMGGIVLVLTIFSKETVLLIKAETKLSVMNLEVVADKTGVMARCSFQNYVSQNGCEVRLYLYRIENDKEIVESQKVLSFAAQGCDITQPRHVPEGVYRASVTIDDGMQIRQINSLNYYQVSRKGEDYIITEIEDNEEKRQSEQESGERKKLDSCCHYKCDYFLKESATPEKNAVQAYQCTDCGAVLEYKEVPNSAYAVFLKEAEKLIQSASPQSEIIINTDRWVSFNIDVLEAMKVR